MEEMLRAFGVNENTLTEVEKTDLEMQGFVCLPNVISEEQTSLFVARLEELLEAEGERAGIEVSQQEGSLRLSDLINKDKIFDYCYTQPRLLAAVSQILSSDFKVHSLNSHFSLPGQGHQKLHADWGSANEKETQEFKELGRYFVANSLWLLDDITDDNGPPRFVPGSHRRGVFIEEEMEDCLQAHPEEVFVNAPAGTVVVFNGHTWHGATLNRSDQPRRVMHMAFVRRHLPQQTDQKAYLRPETNERLTTQMRFLLDV